MSFEPAGRTAITNLPAPRQRLARYAGAAVLALVIALLALLSPTPALAQTAFLSGAAAAGQGR